MKEANDEIVPKLGWNDRRWRKSQEYHQLVSLYEGIYVLVTTNWIDHDHVSSALECVTNRVKAQKQVYREEIKISRAD